MRYSAIALCVLASLVSSGCADQRESATIRRQSSTSQATLERQTPSIPDDVSYSVVSEDKLPGIKRSLDVRLNKKVSEATLRTIALRLKSQDPQDYERTFMAYYLPDMTVDAGAWATTHFNPSLEVRILGMTAEEEERLVAEPTAANWEVIGTWLDEAPFVGARITIFRQGDRLFLEQSFKDGSALKKEVVGAQSPLGRRFDSLERSSSGDHWVVASGGELQLRDDEGLIRTARRID